MKKIQRQLPLALTTVVLGVVVGFSSFLLSVVLDVIEASWLHFKEGPDLPVSIHIAPTQRLASVVAGGIIAAILWYVIQRKYHPVSIKQAVAGKKMPLGLTYVHVLTQIMFVASGNSIGRELAPREAGAALAQWWQRNVGRRLALSDEDQKLLIAAAAGAGFAGVYIAPITGALFCLEILYRKISAKAVAVSLTMATLAAVIGALEKGYGPYYAVSHADFTVASLPLAVILGVLMGIGGMLFKRATAWMSSRRTTDKKILFQLPLVALVTGGIAMAYPQIMGNGRGVAQFAFNTVALTHPLTLGLAFGLVAKLGVTLAVIRFGGYGGTLTPSIALGSVLGVFIGCGYALFCPLPLVQAALIGATAFLAASQQAPLMALFMIFEVCHLSTAALFPLGLAVALSISTAKVLNASTN